MSTEPVSFSEFKFTLGVQVELTLSHEEGTIIGRAHYLDSENSYLVRYVNGNGCQIEAWWGESALS